MAGYSASHAVVKQNILLVGLRMVAWLEGYGIGRGNSTQKQADTQYFFDFHLDLFSTSLVLSGGWRCNVAAVDSKRVPEYFPRLHVENLQCRCTVMVTNEHQGNR